MEVKIIESKKNEMIVQAAGEDHTLGNAIRENLWKDKNIESAAYKIDHPLKGNLEIHVRSSKGKPKEMLVEAARNLERDAKAFKKKFSESCK